MSRLPAFFGALVGAALTAQAASAQFVPPDAPMAQVAATRMPQQFWTPKPPLTPYKAPNKVHWKLSEILAAHKGQSDWTQPLVRNREQEADYISMGAGKKTKTKMYDDDRIVFIVQDGAMKVTIDGVPPFTASKGFLVTVPFRRLYTLETVGDRPALRFEVRHAGAVPMYPLSETPDPAPGYAYEKLAGEPGPAKLNGPTGDNPIYVDFWKDVAIGDKPNRGKFVWDDNFASNILRGKAAKGPAPPATSGAFHTNWAEFWFIMEGKVGYQIEGFPYFEADPGDVVLAEAGRWHQPTNSPNAPMSTRIPFNPRPPLLHNIEPTKDAE